MPSRRVVSCLYQDMGIIWGWTLSDKWLLCRTESHLLIGGERNSDVTTRYADLNYWCGFLECHSARCIVHVSGSCSELLIGSSVPVAWPQGAAASAVLVACGWPCSVGMRTREQGACWNPADEQRVLGSVQINGAVVFLLISIWFAFQTCQCD